jgi:hypothetical protein
VRRHRISGGVDGWQVRRTAAHPLRSSRSVPAEELAHRRGIRPIASADDLVAIDVFESDEELDKFLADLYASSCRHGASLVVLDTDVAAASLRDRLPAASAPWLAGHTIVITFVTLGS